MEQVAKSLLLEYGVGLEVLPVGLLDSLENILFEICHICQHPD